jgi:hypothetical protein
MASKKKQATKGLRKGKKLASQKTLAKAPQPYLKVDFKDIAVSS